MSSHMLEAESFQEKMPWGTQVFATNDGNYCVPFRDEEGETMVTLFTRHGSATLSAAEYLQSHGCGLTEKDIDAGLPYQGSYVYFITDGEFMKIGISVNPKKRLQSIQTGHPKKLRIAALFKGGRDEEFQLHGRFLEHRVHGEWFKFCGPIRQYLAANNNAAVGARASA